MEGKKADFVILEISSFQLETIQNFHPYISLLLNITEDHLDRYRSFDDYRDAKMRIFENQTEKDFAVINKDIIMDSPIRSKKLYFSTHEELNEGAFFKEERMYIRLNNREHIYQRAISPLMGIHNTENLLAVLLIAHLANIGQARIEGVLRDFRGLHHRVEFVREIDGVRFINDSKATNVDATKRALEGIEGDIILIAGGKDKGGSYKAIGDGLRKVKAIVLIGEAKARIADELGDKVDVIDAKDLKEAVEKAFAVAKQGNTVLFSPMCSSFDMFRDYKDRGDRFKKIVENL